MYVYAYDRAKQRHILRYKVAAFGWRFEKSFLRNCLLLRPWCGVNLNTVNLNIYSRSRDTCQKPAMCFMPCIQMKTDSFFGFKVSGGLQPDGLDKLPFNLHVHFNKPDTAHSAITDLGSECFLLRIFEQVSGWTSAGVNDCVVISNTSRFALRVSVRK